MELSKQDTTAIKGIAICLMLWHHLFLRTVEFGNFDILWLKYSRFVWLCFFLSVVMV